MKGRSFYLYLFIDFFSKKFVDWEVHNNESSKLTADIFWKILSRQILFGHEIILHFDNRQPYERSNYVGYYAETESSSLIQHSSVPQSVPWKYYCRIITVVEIPWGFGGKAPMIFISFK